ncbi:hypothetical protein Tco_0317629 [Tanacetum coccineum]
MKLSITTTTTTFTTTTTYGDSGIMEMEPDIENMTLNEYLKYEAEKERRLRRNRKLRWNCDEGNTDDIWDITVEDVEMLRQLLTPTIHTSPEPDLVVQPYVPLIRFPNKLKVVREEEPDNDVDSISIQVPDVMDDMIQPLIP